jgi:hypothetical protein
MRELLLARSRAHMAVVGGLGRRKRGLARALALVALALALAATLPALASAASPSVLSQRSVRNIWRGC